jgi:hypothetical protein
METWKDVIARLQRIRHLKDNWDGEGSVAPSTDLVDGAIAFARDRQVNKRLPPDRVIASVNGTVYFEWYSFLGYCEIEVTSPMEAEYRWIFKGEMCPARTKKFTIKV